MTMIRIDGARLKKCPTKKELELIDKWVKIYKSRIY